MNLSHEHYMKLALLEAEKAFEADEVPVGAIIVMKDQIIAKAFNQVEMLKDATAHAEILALTAAFQYLGSKYLPEATLYVSLEPCVMCAGALYWSKIGQVVYGASDAKNGYSRCCHSSPFHPKTDIIQGIYADEGQQFLKSFFQAKRRKPFG